jgi:enoyl-CoA hydratase/carnithine racemase
MIAASEVLYEVDQGVAVLTFNRPEANNGQTESMEQLYLELLAKADDDPDVRVIVVTGAGRTFCVGGDMEYAQAVVRAGGWNKEIPHAQETYALWVRKPVVAAINGGCAGMGLVYALTCDIRFAAAGAKLATAFVRRGLAAERGISWYLQKTVGQAHAMDLLLSGRAVTSEEAERIGLVNRTVPADQLMDVTMAWARDVAANSSPSGMAAIKQQILDDADRNLVTSLSDAAIICARATRGPDFAEGILSYVERRPPTWQPLGPSPLRADSGGYREGDYG